MSRLKEFYKRNVYGVMGTLVFHILLVSAFILAEIDIKGNMREEEIIIEFPDLLPEELIAEDPAQKEEIPAETAAQSSETRTRTTNVASNRLSQKGEFFDQDYLNEVNAAKQLVSDVNSQLSKEIVDLKDIKMPVETTEGMNPDSIKNIIYTGESNIIYYLENRYHLSLPIPVYLAQGGGKIIVDIVVNRNGKVIQATARKNQSIRDEQIFLYAQVAASRTIFNTDFSAPAQQKGTIEYNFIAQ
jgi:hypothetical protein